MPCNLKCIIYSKKGDDIMESCDNNYCINDCCNDNCCNEDWCNDDWCCDTICCDERCALASIIQSVAMIEASLSSIICAEGLKIKKAVCLANNLNELIRINESVRETIEIISQLEEALKQKAVYAIEALKELKTD